MKFDIIIGNPPYQESTGAGNNGGQVLYDKFIVNGLRLLNDKTKSGSLCMIVKNNWMYSNSLKELRNDILSSGLKELVNYSLLGDIFPSVGIAASIIYIDKSMDDGGKTLYTEIQKGEVISRYHENIKNMPFIPSSLLEYNIVRKVEENTKEYFSRHVTGLNPFGIGTNGLTGGQEIEESLVKTEEHNIGLMYDDYMTYTGLNCFSKNKELVGKFKIICPKQTHKTNNPIPRIIGLKPNYVCTASFSLLYHSDDAQEAVNVYSYIGTKFFRFLVYCLSDTLCVLNAYRVSLVPDQDFTSNSDIDWSQSFSEIDQQLYKKYKLTQEEIEYIERTIKQME